MGSGIIGAYLLQMLSELIEVFEIGWDDYAFAVGVVDVYVVERVPYACNFIDHGSVGAED